MIDDKNAPPVAARKTLKLSSPKAATPKPAPAPVMTTRAAPSAASATQHVPKSGRGSGPVDWADAHKRRMQADMDALNAPAAIRR